MFEEIKKQSTPLRMLVILLIVAASIYLLQIFWQAISNFSDILVMIIIAWLLSFVLEPLVHLVARLTKVSKLISAVIVYAFFASFFAVLIFLFIPNVINQFQSLAKVIPHFLAPYPTFIQTWNSTITKSADILIGLIPSLATVLIDTVLMLILSFYFIVDKERINSELYNYAPKSWHKNLRFVQGVVDTTFSSFFRIQVIFGIFAGISTWIILTIFGIPFAASISLLAGVLTVIPVFGQFLGALPPAFVVLVTHPNSPLEALLIFAVLVLIQQIVFNVLGPKLMGNAFKLHPLVVFLSIIIGYKIAGGLGAVLVVPVLGIFVIVLKQLGPYFINSQPQSDDEN